MQLFNNNHNILITCILHCKHHIHNLMDLKHYMSCLKHITHKLSTIAAAIFAFKLVLRMLIYCVRCRLKNNDFQMIWVYIFNASKLLLCFTFRVNILQIFAAFFIEHFFFGIFHIMISFYSCCLQLIACKIQDSEICQ